MKAQGLLANFELVGEGQHGVGHHWGYVVLVVVHDAHDECQDLLKFGLQARLLTAACSYSR